MSPRLFHYRVAVHIRQQTQTKPTNATLQTLSLPFFFFLMNSPLRIAGICEAVNGNGGLAGVKSLANSRIQLIVTDAAPEGGFAV